MPQDFISTEEACKKLGKSTDELTAIARAGKLSEIRDGGKVFYRAAEIEALAASEGSSVVDLQAGDESAPAEIDLDDSSTFASALSSLADSSATLGAIDESPAAEEPPALETETPVADGSDSKITFAPDDEADGSSGLGELTIEDIPDALAAAPKEGLADESPAADIPSEIDLLPDDDQEADEVPDLGLSGSSIISLEPGADSTATGLAAAKDGSKAAKIGINVFDEGELDVETDPMGETQIAANVEEFDTVGSGSGLLDIGLESDDTSLDPELLDVISPSDAAETELEVEAVDGETITEEGPAIEEMPHDEDAIADADEAPAVMAPSRAVSSMEMAGAVPLNVCLLVGLLGLAVMGLATAATVQGVWPARIFNFIDDGVQHWSVFGGLALVAIVTGVLSILAGRGK